MKYLDSGNRSPKQALAYWLETVLTEEVIELRWQTGYFGADVLSCLSPCLCSLADRDAVVRALVGSNERRTPAVDVRALCQELRLPRNGARLGVVVFQAGLFHPKTLHLRFTDGHQAAYIGSANLTRSGISALNVEAGVIADSREGDPVALLEEVAAGIDSWFEDERPGLYEIRNEAEVDRLLESNLLTRHLSKKEWDLGRTDYSHLPSLRPLVPVEPWQRDGEEGAEKVESPGPRRPLPIAPKKGFPQYLLFDPDPESQRATQGASALSGTNLPQGAVGLVIQLNQDSVRHFQGRSGTANISLPVATVQTFRFGQYQGKQPRPRAEFRLRIRYFGRFEEHEFDGSWNTNVSGYGFLDSETSHRDIRFLLPRPATRRLEEVLESRGWGVPEPEDLAFLEWPTRENPRFALSFLARDSKQGEKARDLFNEAKSNQALLGEGACWLPSDCVPGWSD